jgi:hypothetical protein
MNQHNNPSQQPPNSSQSPQHHHAASTQRLPQQNAASNAAQPSNEQQQSNNSATAADQLHKNDDQCNNAPSNTQQHQNSPHRTRNDAVDLTINEQMNQELDDLMNDENEPEAAIDDQMSQNSRNRQQSNSHTVNVEKTMQEKQGFVANSSHNLRTDSNAASSNAQQRDWQPIAPEGCLSVVMRTPPHIIAAPKQDVRSSQSATAMRISGILLKCSALESVRQQLSNRATPMPSSASFMHTEHQSGYTVWRLRWMNHAHVKAFCETIASIGKQCPISLSFEQQKLIAIVTPYRLDPRFDHECEQVLSYLKQAAPNAQFERMHQNNVPTAKLKITTDSMNDINAIRAAVSKAICGPSEDAICFHPMRLSHRKQTNTCARCLAAGHFTAQCPQTERTCAKCNRVGHIQSECTETQVQATASPSSLQSPAVIATASASPSSAPASASALATEIIKCNHCQMNHSSMQCPLKEFQNRASYVTVASSRRPHNAPAGKQNVSAATVTTSVNSTTSPLMTSPPHQMQDNATHMDMQKLCYAMMQQTSQQMQMMMQQQQMMIARMNKQDAILEAICKAINIPMPAAAAAATATPAARKRQASNPATSQTRGKRTAAPAAASAVTVPSAAEVELTQAAALQSSQPTQLSGIPVRMPNFGVTQSNMLDSIQPLVFGANATGGFSNTSQISVARTPLAPISSNASNSTALNATSATTLKHLADNQSATMQQSGTPAKANNKPKINAKSRQRQMQMPSRNSQRIASLKSSKSAQNTHMSKAGAHNENMENAETFDCANASHHESDDNQQ